MVLEIRILLLLVIFELSLFRLVFCRVESSVPTDNVAVDVISEFAGEGGEMEGLAMWLLGRSVA
jgi:hypothetical protein